MSNTKILNQYFTPAWAAELLFDKHFGNLTSNDLVWEPTCGTGNCLAAIPAHIPAFGSELDEALIIQAQKRTGRHVLYGDCRSVKLPNGITAVFGNPPFNLTVFEGLLIRCSHILHSGNKAGFILPAYFFQTSNTMLRLSRKWAIGHEMLPKDLFKRLSIPLIFATFLRDDRQQLIGFSLYHETADLCKMERSVREALRNNISGSRSVWKNTVAGILQAMGGKANLTDIYNRISKHRPTANQFWKAKVRQCLQSAPFVRLDEGYYEYSKN